MANTGAKYCTYSVFDPTIQQVIYVGMTSNLLRRIKQHGKKSSWWKPELRFDQLDQELNQQQAREREKYWIQRYTSEGHTLNNFVHNEFSPIEQQMATEYHNSILQKYSHLPEDRAEQMAKMIEEGENRFGGWAWHECYKTVYATIACLENDGLLSTLSEIEVAKIAYRLFGVTWEGAES